jgi:hypothetical protein
MHGMKAKARRGLFDGVKPIYRLGLVLVSFVCIGIGILRILEGKTNELNPWDQMVFAPFAIFIGVCCFSRWSLLGYEPNSFEGKGCFYESEQTNE